MSAFSRRKISPIKLGMTRWARGRKPRAEVLEGRIPPDDPFGMVSQTLMPSLTFLDIGPPPAGVDRPEGPPAEDRWGREASATGGGSDRPDVGPRVGPQVVWAAARESNFNRRSPARGLSRIGDGPTVLPLAGGAVQPPAPFDRSLEGDSDVRSDSPPAMPGGASGGSPNQPNLSAISAAAGPDASAPLPMSAKAAGPASPVSSMRLEGLQESAANATPGDEGAPFQPGASGDPPVYVSGAESAEEGEPGFITIYLGGLLPAGQRFLPVMFTVGGSATLGEDYDWSFSPGFAFVSRVPGTESTFTAAIDSFSFSQAPLRAAIVPDGIPERSETIVVTLIGGPGYSLEDPSSHTLTIKDADSPFDLDVDSDNTAAIGVPERTLAEEQIEDGVLVGKRVLATAANLDGDNIPDYALDRDHDGVPDFADGFNRDQIAGNEDDINAVDPQDRFTPMILEVPQPIDLNRARLRFTYDASDPAGVTGTTPGQPYGLPSGHLRIWTEDADRPRNPAGLNTSVLGDFVAPNQDYSATQLGLTGARRTVTLYIEGIAPSATAGDQRIALQVDRDGPGPDGFEFEVVRTTVTPAERTAVAASPFPSPVTHHEWSMINLYRDYEALVEAAVIAWRAVCLVPELVRSVCAAPYIHLRT